MYVYVYTYTCICTKNTQSKDICCAHLQEYFCLYVWLLFRDFSYLKCSEVFGQCFQTQALNFGCGSCVEQRVGVDDLYASIPALDILWF